MKINKIKMRKNQNKFYNYISNFNKSNLNYDFIYGKILPLSI